MTKSIKMKCLPRLLEKITNTNTPNNSEFTYYGYRVLMSSGTTDYTSVTIEDRYSNNILDFSIDFLTLECNIERYCDYDMRDSLVNALKKLYNGKWKMRFSDQPLELDLYLYESMLGNDEYDQEYVQKVYDELVKHKID